MGLFERIKRIFKRQEPLKLGLALGSGGAKGMAHLGAIKAFEEAGLSFSAVTGSSIGAIVGALYAKGYSSADMTGIVEGLNRKEFSKNLRPFADLGFAESFLENYLDGDIASLPVPFGAWATDGETNEGVPLTAGKAARAVTASAAIPPFFRGVDIDGKRLYDGAFSNAVPSDLCKTLGAQFVIGIDLGAFVRPEEEKGMLSRLLGTAIGAIVPVHYTADSKTRGYSNADVMLRPALGEFRATDISAASMDRMFELGYAEAKNRLPEIREAIEKKGREARK